MFGWVLSGVTFGPHPLCVQDDCREKNPLISWASISISSLAVVFLLGYINISLNSLCVLHTHSGRSLGLFHLSVGLIERTSDIWIYIGASLQLSSGGEAGCTPTCWQSITAEGWSGKDITGCKINEKCQRKCMFHVKKYKNHSRNIVDKDNKAILFSIR